MSENRLIQGMFGSEFNSKKADVLSYLRCGQMRALDYCHNAGWYNKYGEKIGWGDLDISDLKKIRDELLPSEAFLILGETESFWKYVTSYGNIGGMCSTSDEMNKANLSHALEHARFLIVSGKIYIITYDKNDEGKAFKPEFRVPSSCQDVTFEHAYKAPHSEGLELAKLIPA